MREQALEQAPVKTASGSISKADGRLSKLKEGDKGDKNITRGTPF